MQITGYSEGMPSWAELVTTDVPAAVEFYTSLFGWDDEPNDAGDGMQYHMQKLGDAYVSAIAAQQPMETEQGIPPHWNTYITVDDIAATVGRVADVGGQVFAPPFPVMEAGTMAVIADPTGAALNLWQPGEHIGSGVRGEPNAIGWSELMTSDPASAGAFLNGLFGLDPVATEGTDIPYTMLQLGDEPVAGMLELTGDMAGMPSAWLTYFQVADIDEARERAIALGAEAQGPPMEAPEIRFAVLADPQGAVFAIVQNMGM